MAPSALNSSPDNAYTGEYLQGLKRKDLLALCKKHDIKCVGKNTELIEKLLALGQNEEESRAEEIETIETEGQILNENATEAAPETPIMGVHQDMSLASEEDKSPKDTTVDDTEEVNDNEPSPKSAKVEVKNEESFDYKPSPKLVKSQEIAPVKETVELSPRRASAPNPTSNLGDQFSGQPMTKVKSNSAPHIRPLTKTQTNSTTQPKKKFDLKESLKRPLTYKPYTGPLKPFNQNANDHKK